MGEFIHNLPAQHTTFIGRSKELAELSALLTSPDCQLLTLAGPGGIGKTRLAIEIAAQTQAAFNQGVYFVPLQPLRCAGDIVPTIAVSLDLQFYGEGDPQRQLLNYLSNKQLLLILDNFEHLLTGVDLLMEVLRAAPQVKLLVTSREILRLREEWVREVAGLNYPVECQSSQGETFSAMQLFEERARHVSGDFSLSTEWDSVANICRVVEGLPLALELAAAWRQTLPCSRIADEISQSLNFLSTTWRDMPSRHHSIHAVFDWSWGLLLEDEQNVFKKLSVFQGGFHLVAAQTVANATLPVLSSLVEKSLLRVDSSGRYDIHELLRQFAQEKLDEMPVQKESTLDLHCDYYTVFLQQREQGLRAQQSSRVTKELEEEIDNVRLAWKWAIERRKIAQIGDAIWCFAEFYDYQGWYREGEKSLDQAVTLLRTEQPLAERGIALGLALAEQGNFLQYLGQSERAKSLIHESIAILRPLNASPKTAHVLYRLGMVYFRANEMLEATKYYRQSVVLAKEVGDYITLAFSLLHMSFAAGAAGFGETHKLLQLRQESLAYFRQINHRLGVAMAIGALGTRACGLGDYEQAEHYLEEAHGLLVGLNHRLQLSINYEMQGTVAHALGNCEAAVQLLEEGMRISQEATDLWRLPYILLALGNVSYTRQDMEQARQIYLTTLTIAREAGSRHPEAWSLHNLGRIAFYKMDYVRANQFFRESLDIFRETGSRWGVTSTLNILGGVAIRTGNKHKAQHYLYDALQSAIEYAAPKVLLEVLVGFAELFVAQGNREYAVELLALGLHHTASHIDTKMAAQRLLSDLENRLPADAFASAQKRGLASDLDEVADRCLTRSTSPRKDTFVQPLLDPLTKTELQVLRLLDSDLPYSEVASMRHVGLNTIKTHRRNIFSKLGVHTRDEAIRKARVLRLI